MACKYCIVPQKTNKFHQLIAGMTLTKEQQILFQNCFIKHIEVSPEILTWEILLETKSFLDEALLAMASRHIKDRCGLREVIFYQKIVDLGAVLQKAWGEIVNLAAGESPSLRSVLWRSQHRMQEGQLLVRIGNRFVGELLNHHDVAAQI